MKTEIKNFSNYIKNGIISRRSNLFFGKLIPLFFRKVDFDDESKSTINEYSKKGQIVYASFQSTNTALLILVHLLKKNKIAIPELSLDFKPYLFQKISSWTKKLYNSFKNLFDSNKYENVSDFDYIKNNIVTGKGAVLSLLSGSLFLKRFLYIKSDSIQYLVDIQKKSETPIYVFPQIMFWNRNPERTKNAVSLKATGDRGLLSALFITLKSATLPFMRVSAPINLQDEIENSGSDDSKIIARLIRNKLLDTYNHEKRAILGPVIKTRQEMMEKVLFHKNVLDAIQDESKLKKSSEKKLRRKAFRYFKEIAADFSIIYIRFFEKILDYIFNRIFDGIHFDIEDFKKIREISQKGPLILMPNHKSHMDYLILSRLFYKNKLSPPHVLAGANLTFFPMGKLFRRTGAFFMRRSFKGLNLYAAVFKQYVKTIVSEGYSIEFFIEGGRTRSGKIVLPKMGMLKYLIESIEEGYHKDIIFLPISINYDRILEETSYHKEQKGKNKKTESTSNFMKSRNLLKRKYGKVYVAFNEPLSYQNLKKEMKIEDSNELTTEIGNLIVKKINNVIMVTPFSLVTSAILYSSIKGFTKKILQDKILILFNYLKSVEAKLSDLLMGDVNFVNIIDYVLEAYEEDNIVEKLKFEDGNSDDEDQSEHHLYVLKEEERGRINFYKNNIIHFLLPISYISLLILSEKTKGDIIRGNIKTGLSHLKDLFNNEFIYCECMDDDEETVESTLNYLSSIKMIDIVEDKITILENGIDELKYYAKIIQEYFESYIVVLNTIFDIPRKRISKKMLTQEIRKSGIKMYHLEQIKLYESLSTSNYNNALIMLTEKEILKEFKENKRNPEFKITDPASAKELYKEFTDYLAVLE